MEAHPEVAAVYSPYIAILPDGKETLSGNDDATTGSIFTALLCGNYCGSPISALVRRDAFETAGYFDESLLTAEDYDVWFRLAFNLPFKFVSGLVAIHPRSLQDKYSLHLVRGTPGVSARYLVERAVIENALALLSDTPGHTTIKQQARAHLEVRTASALCDIGEFGLMKAQILAGLDRCPSVLRYRWARASLAEMVARSAIFCDSPIADIRAFCEELDAAGARRGFMNWVQRSQTLASIWSELGIHLISSRRYKMAGHAFAFNLRQQPALLPWRVTRFYRKRAVGLVFRRAGTRALKRPAWHQHAT